MQEEIEYGPCMRALTPKQRKYVLAMARDPFASATEWTTAAGYSPGSYGGRRVEAHRLSHDPKVRAAVEEVARQHLGVFGPMLASTGLLRIAANPKHPQHVRALELIANRTGLHEKTEHEITVRHDTVTPER